MKLFTLVLILLAFTNALTLPINNRNRKSKDNDDLTLRINHIFLKSGDESVLIEDKEANLTMSWNNLKSSAYNNGFYFQLSRNITDFKDIRNFQQFFSYFQPNQWYVPYNSFSAETLQFFEEKNNFYITANLTNDAGPIYRTYFELEFNKTETNEIINNGVSTIFDVIKNRVHEINDKSKAIEKIERETDRLLDIIETLQSSFEVLARSPNKAPIVENLKKALNLKDCKFDRNQISSYIKELY